METPETTLNEIARLITEGFTDGMLDDGDNNNNIRTAWNLELNTFIDNGLTAENKGNR